MNLQKHSHEERSVIFMDHVSSLILQSMVSLGRVENPLTKKTSKNLKQASILILTLEILQEKTKGNLTEIEQQYINQGIVQLRTEYEKEIVS